MPITTKVLECKPDLCRHCYERRIRSVVKEHPYDIDAILKRLEKYKKDNPKGNVPCLHGGEPLSLPFEDVEKLLEKTWNLFGSSTIQTNGLLIKERHIELFKKYHTSVGVSIDGDTAQLNWERCNATDLPMDEIQKLTDRTIKNMKRLKKAGISVSIIAILRKCNASKENLPDFIKFMLRMRDEFGIKWARTNEGIVYEEKWKDSELSSDELFYAFSKLADICLGDRTLQWYPYRDVINAMFGYLGNMTCNFTECDVWATQSEKTILPNGELGCCLKGGAALDGIQALRSEPSKLGHRGRERYVILRQIPQELYGCKGCRFWHICKGGCPGEAIDNDWRNHTRFCESWKAMFAYIENKIKGMFPNISLLPDFYPGTASPSIIRSSMEVVKGDSLTGGEPKIISDLRKLNKVEVKNNDPNHGDTAHGNAHGDSGHGDSGHGDKEHGDSGHGDNPHGDK